MKRCRQAESGNYVILGWLRAGVFDFRGRVCFSVGIFRVVCFDWGMRKSAMVALGSVLIWAALSLPAAANPGHEVTIAELTAQIVANPQLPELYFQRAWNYREIQKPAEARADWEKTLSLNPHFLPASRELARTDAAEGHVDEGIAKLRQAIAAAPPDQSFHVAGCYSVIAELLLKQNKNPEALAAVEAGLEAAQDVQMDLCLLRAEAQRRLGKMDERVRDLEAVMKKLKSYVVRSKWYDAMIDAGRGGEVLPAIEEEIANTRYHASWLIRRARVRLSEGNAGAAAPDLTAALAEIGPRLRPEFPDVSLLVDRGVAHALQGDHAAAAQDLALAREKGGDFWMTLPLAALMEKSSPPATPNKPVK
ncbi:MAG: hypothetical protein JWL81_1489 [Verrucomicrobiales bacterium]|nr:hypothetical protein [Verrucomicrobiales bacterium]